MRDDCTSSCNSFKISIVPTSIEIAVLDANRAFYTAFQKRDNNAMEHVWAEEHPSSCIHPGWAPLMGREAVMASWRAIFGCLASAATSSSHCP